MLYDISDPKFRAAVLAFMLARKAAARRGRFVCYTVVSVKRLRRALLKAKPALNSQWPENVIMTKKGNHYVNGCSAAIGTYDNLFARTQ